MNETVEGVSVSSVWGEWVAGWGEWHVFGALTYRQQATTELDITYARSVPHPEAVAKHVTGWLNHCNRQLHNRIEAAVVAVESHKSGWPHAHPLLRLAGGLQSGDIVTLGTAWFDRRGYARLEKPRSTDDVCAYAAKYLTKDLARGDLVLYPRSGSVRIHQERLTSHDLSKGGSRRSAAAAARG